MRTIIISLLIILLCNSQVSLASSERRIESIDSKVSAVKGKIFAKYNAKLREHPSLGGRIEAELTITPRGLAKSCRTNGSTIQNLELLNETCSILKAIDYGEEPNVDDFTHVYTIELLPL